MSQNLLSLGLDVSSFDEQKKKTLNDFISLFDKLSKYDNLQINPVMGTGLAEFNNSIKQTNVLVGELNAKISQLSSLQNQNNSSTSASTSVRNVNTQSIQKSAEAKVRAAEAATRLAAADVREASAAAQAAQSELKLANANLASASSSEKKTAQAAQYAAMQKFLASVMTLRVASESRLVAAENQLSAAQELSAISANKDAAAQQRAADAITRAEVASRDAAGAIAYSEQVTANATVTLNKSAESASAFGNQLSRAFGYLRTLAYILPGIGIAGIFNLAYEIIGDILSSLDIMGESVGKVASREADINNHLKERLSIYKEIYDQRQKADSLVSSFSVLSRNRETSVKEARGIEEGQILSDRLSIAQQAFIEASNKVDIKGSVSQIYDEIKSLTEKQVKIANDLKFTEKILDSKNEQSFSDKLRLFAGLLPTGGATETAYKSLKSKKVGGVQYQVTEDDLKDLVKMYKSELDLTKQNTEQKLSNLEDYVNASGELSKAQAAQQKFVSDELRRAVVENAKNEISTSINKNKAILSDERSTYEERIKAIQDIGELNKRLADTDYINVFGTATNPNLSATDADKKIAIKKKAEEYNKIEIDVRKQTVDTMIEYYQRFLDAQEKIDKDSVEKSLISSEKIYKNEQNSLAQRLAAYTDYIIKRQQLQTIELQRDLKKGSSEPGGKTSLTPEEADALKSGAITQQFNIQADAEKAVYEIVTTSLSKELKAIKDFNTLSEDATHEAHTKELKNLNDLFEKKGISLKKYEEEAKKINRKYRNEYLDSLIKDDDEELERLRKFLEKQKDLLKKADNDVETTSIGLSFAKAEGKGVINAQRAYDQSVGEQNAIKKGITDTEKEIKRVEKERDENRLKRQKQNYDDVKEAETQEKRRRLEILSEIEKAEKAVYNAVTTIEDRRFQKEIERINILNEATQEFYQNEIDAIERSSLSEKEKTALSIRLTAEKTAKDKEAAAEVKRIRREQAEFDKKASIAQIVVSTALSIIKAYTEGDPYTKVARAVLAGVAGAAALTTAASADIPSYEEGTHGVPHKGGLARTGEKGKPELIFEPYKSPYLVNKENVSYLPPGTEVVPLKDYIENTDVKSVKSDGWEQTIFLANQIKKLKPKGSKIINNINIDLGFETHKAKKIYGIK